jgi:hypothetical protein
MVQYGQIIRSINNFLPNDCIMDNETPKDFVTKYKEELQEQEEIFNNFLTDLNTNPKYQDYFSKYHPDSVIRFKEEFARYKTLSLALESYFRKKEEKLVHRYLDIAYRLLWEIQNFKLLQLESKWRNKQLNIEGFKYTYQFTHWHRHIEECPFLDPITQQEVDTYLQYLQQEDVDGSDLFSPEYMNNLKVFEKIRRDIIDDRPLPGYIKFMLNLYGKDMFMIEDFRGNKEKRYTDAVNEERRKKHIETTSSPDYDARPCIFFSDNTQFNEAINKFGTNEMLDYKKAHDELMHANSGWGYFEESIALLQEAGEDYPIDFHEDWHWAIINAAENYKKANVIRAIKVAYKEYVFRLNNGIAFSKHEGYRLCEENNEWFKKHSLKNIKKGMELLGEEGAFELD